MNNHFEENFHHVPVGEMPSRRYEQRNLNALLWLRPLEHQHRQRRIAIYNRKQMEIDELYEQLAAVRQQQTKGN